MHSLYTDKLTALHFIKRKLFVKLALVTHVDSLPDPPPVFRESQFRIANIEKLSDTPLPMLVFPYFISSVGPDIVNSSGNLHHT